MVVPSLSRIPALLNMATPWTKNRDTVCLAESRWMDAQILPDAS